MKRLLFVTVICAFGAVPAMGDLNPVYETTWNPVGIPGLLDEWDLASQPTVLPYTSGPGDGGGGPGVNDILDYYYTSWTRIDDYGVFPNDQLWWDLDGGALVKAIYTSSNLYLGYSTNESTGGSPVWLSGSGGGNLDTVGETASFNIVPNSDAFVWLIGGSATQYSLQALNPGGQDKMVSFRIHGILNTPGVPGDGYSVPGVPTYIIGFEDRTNNPDLDYQDFVAEVSNVAVPVPGAVLLGILGLSVAGVKLRKFA